MKYFKSEEHHFSACQIMISEASSSMSLQSMLRHENDGINVTSDDT
jgi:hypothetical protein